MSALEGALLLAGIFGVPLALLASGHRFRRLGRRMRGAFWGGGVGFACGSLVWALATMAPAQMWAQGSIRLTTVVSVLIVSGVAGFIIGGLVGNTPKRRHHHRRGKAAPEAREHASADAGDRPSANT